MNEAEFLALASERCAALQPGKIFELLDAFGGQWPDGARPVKAGQIFFLAVKNEQVPHVTLAGRGADNHRLYLRA